MYKGEIKVYREEGPINVGSRDFNGLILDVKVTAKTPDSLNKKIAAIMATMEGES